MDAHDAYTFTLAGPERTAYLRALDGALSVLGTVIDDEMLRTVIATEQAQRTRKHAWSRDLSALIAKSMGGAQQWIGKQREMYALLTSRDSTEHPELNYLAPNSTDFDNSSGLPSRFAIDDLFKAGEKGVKTPDFRAFAREIAALGIEDAVAPEEMANAATEIRTRALRANYTSRVHNANLPDIRDGAIMKATFLGLDDLRELWAVQYLAIPYVSSKLQINTVILAQDPHEEHVRLENGRPAMSADFSKLPVLSEQNAGWYKLKKIDEKYEGIHPLFLSRFFIGPFQSGAVTRVEDGIEKLAVFDEIEKADPAAATLRCVHLYAFSPDSEETMIGKQARLRQNVIRQDFADEIIIAPTAHAETLSKRLGGANVRIFEYEVK